MSVANSASLAFSALGFQAVERFKEHLALAGIGRVQARMQGLLRSGQEESERPVIGGELSARAGAHMQSGCVGGDYAQATPALGFEARCEMFEQARTQGIESLRRKPAPCLAECPVTDFSTTTGLAR